MMKKILRIKEKNGQIKVLDETGFHACDKLVDLSNKYLGVKTYKDKYVTSEGKYLSKEALDEDTRKKVVSQTEKGSYEDAIEVKVSGYSTYCSCCGHRGTNIEDVFKCPVCKSEMTMELNMARNIIKMPMEHRTLEKKNPKSILYGEDIKEDYFGVISSYEEKNYIVAFMQYCSEHYKDQGFKRHILPLYQLEKMGKDFVGYKPSYFTLGILDEAIGAKRETHYRLYDMKYEIKLDKINANRLLTDFDTSHLTLVYDSISKKLFLTGFNVNPSIIKGKQQHEYRADVDYRERKRELKRYDISRGMVTR